MAGFFRKVAGAFVELPADTPDLSGEQAVSEPGEGDVSDLLEQLESAKADSRKAKSPAEAAPSADADPLTLSTDQVFELAGIVEGPNSTNRLMKMLAGLAMFPPEQQLAMVRALDAADESWTEQGVLADARDRQQALRLHTDRIEREHARRATALGERGKADQARSDAVIADIDKQIAELQRLRQQALQETANAMAALDGARRDLDHALDQARKGSAQVATRLSELIAFFAGPARSTASHGGS
jgi:hypothetical protein